MTTIAGVKLADMKRTKESLKPGNVGALSPDPYSADHRISLDQDALDKLGIGETPKVGAKFHVMGEAHVHSVNSDSYAGGKPKTRVGLTFHKLGVVPAPTGGNRDTALGAVNKGIGEANE